MSSSFQKLLGPQLCYWEMNDYTTSNLGGQVGVQVDTVSAKIMMQNQKIQKAYGDLVEWTTHFCLLF